MAGSLTIDNINGKVISSSPVATESQVIGVGQTWKDVTASRAAGTTYTNSTGKPIYVAIMVSGGGGTNSSIYIDGIAIGYVVAEYGFNNGSEFFIVPSGSTYSVSSGITLTSWKELR